MCFFFFFINEIKSVCNGTWINVSEQIDSTERTYQLCYEQNSSSIIKADEHQSFQGNVIIPNDADHQITEIGFEAFALCSDLTSVIINAPVTIISGRAFSDCPNLMYVSIPPTVTTICYQAFNRWTNHYNPTAGSLTLHFVGQSQWSTIQIADGETDPSDGRMQPVQWSANLILLFEAKPSTLSFANPLTFKVNTIEVYCRTSFTITFGADYSSVTTTIQAHQIDWPFPSTTPCDCTVIRARHRNSKSLLFLGAYGALGNLE